MGNSSSNIYDFTAYYIHWFMDKDCINSISILNDELNKRFGISLTYTQSIQLYNVLGEMRSRDLSLGIGHDILGGPVIAVSTEEQLIMSFSVCTCCSYLGIIEDKRKILIRATASVDNQY